MVSQTTEPAEANEQFTGSIQTPWASYTTQKKVQGTMTRVSHAERISLLSVPRGITLSAIASCAFKPTQPLGRRKKTNTSLWLPLAIHFYLCITSQMLPQPSLYGSVVNYSGNWPRVAFLLRYLPARSDSSSLTGQPHTSVPTQQEIQPILFFLTSPSPQKSYLTLNTKTTALGEKARNCGGLDCLPNPEELYYHQNNLFALKNILQSVINGNGHSKFTTKQE